MVTARFTNKMLLKRASPIGPLNPNFRSCDFYKPPRKICVDLFEDHGLKCKSSLKAGYSFNCNKI